MSIRRSDVDVTGLRSNRRKLAEERSRKLKRRLLLESLEERRLLAVGPQLVGIQPNEGELLSVNQVRTIAPRELLFQFEDGSDIDPATLSGIRVTRSGFDGQFEKASYVTDFGTNGQVIFQFSAVAPGTAGNSLALRFTKSDHGSASPPTIVVSGNLITVDLNTNFRNETKAVDLLQALGADPQASALISTSIERGNITTNIATPAQVGSTIFLSGANQAFVTTNLNAGTNLQVKLTAAQSGPTGNDIAVEVTRVDRGGPATPRVTVTGRRVQVELNSNFNNETTVQEFVSAINGSSAASSLLAASLQYGDPLTKVGNRTVNYSPLVLRGANDVELTPGFVGVAPSGREVIFRFAENLPDDRYRIDVLGAGTNALKNMDGEAFNNGRDQSLEFRLDLAPRVEAVVPQPITRVNGVLQQARNQIVVYFNHDHLAGDTLDPAKASDPSFYKLYLTKNTARNTDDTLVPATVTYNAATETATLTFSNDLAQLAGAGLTGATLRLRIGTDEGIPSVPVTMRTTSDPGSSFNTALDLTPTWTTTGNSAQSLIVTSEIVNTTPFALDYPGAQDEPGHRDIARIQDHLPGGADRHDGVSTLFYNFQTEYGFDTRGNVLRNAITENQKLRAREVFELYGHYLGVQFIESANFGFTVATGDLRAITPTIPTGIGEPRSLSELDSGRIILELQDFNSAGDDVYGGPWFLQFMKELGRLMGFGPTNELAPLTVASVDVASLATSTAEPVFPGDNDIVHGQHLFRPESNDIDLYKFTLAESGSLDIETLAERRGTPSLLNTTVSIYRELANGSHELVSRNDDYFSRDSRVQLDLGPGTYFVGVSASGNGQYDPEIEESGLGGTSGDDPSTTSLQEGAYDLRLTFRPNADRALTDTGNNVFDGDGDGVAGGVYDFWFRTQTAARTMIVDKSALPGGDGSLGAPFQRIQTALDIARQRESAGQHSIVRIIGNGGADGDLATPADNLAYEIGFNRLGAQLADGATFDVPKNVTVMVDQGAVFKMRRSMVGVGSTAVNIDRSGGALQVLGTPRLIGAGGQNVRDANGQIVSGDVYFTSIHDSSLGKDTNPDTSHPAAAAGDWGGIWFRNDLDQMDKRFQWESEGIFLNSVNHADIRFGGGSVIVGGNPQAVAPVHMSNSRPSITYNKVAGSADAALSANPDSFLETNFNTHEFQSRGAFTPDYDRVGPQVYFNRLTGSSINGLFVRLKTAAGSDLETLTVAGRFDDVDTVHVIAENLVVEGAPGGPVAQAVTPPTQLVKLNPLTTGTLPLGSYNYRITFVDGAGNEGSASEPTRTISLTGGQSGVLLDQLPRVPSGTSFVSRRIYRSQPTGDGPYTLVTTINATRTTLIDDGASLGGELPASAEAINLQSRLNASLAIDPGTVVKLDGSRIETTMGAQVIAEGREGREVVMTSLRDNRFGAGGTFDTSNQGVGVAPLRGDWGGVMIGPLGKLSLDHTLVAYAGGVTKMDSSFAGVNAVELHQATARITNSTFEQNARGVGGQAPASRFGRGGNAEGSIFIRGSQPVIVNNDFQHNTGSAINANVNALNFSMVADPGRSTGIAEPFDQFGDNAGPLIRLNRLADNGGVDNNGVLFGTNGMVVRGGTLTTEGIWDDTDIVHVVNNEAIVVPDFHSYGGLSLRSGATESLVVKLDGANAGFTATGRPLDIHDRIGGAVHLVGQPRFPVVLSDVRDDSVGAGFQPDGTPQTDTNNDGEFRDVIDTGGGVCPAPTSNVLTVTSTSNNGDQLRDALLGSGISPIGTSIFTGSATAAGFFENGSVIGIPCGVLLTTGDATFAAGPNAADSSTGLSSGAPDPQLDALFGVSTQDTTALEFQFVSTGGALFFNYVFASEEYNEFANGIVNDSFAFFLDGTNIALVPGTGQFVSINNVNGGNPLGTGAVNPQFYNNNDIQDAGPFLNEFGYDGFTDVFTATATNLSPGVHTIRLVISDVGDTAWDSGVFLQLGSFSDRPPANPPSAGSWQGVSLLQNSHDRNVGLTLEHEANNGQVPGVNGSVTTPQYLGTLAPNEKSGDETQRLGFTVDGFVSRPADQDVYSFNARAGTEVWLDIDRTRATLDSVVELVDSSGQILALSNDSNAEETAGALTFRAPGVAAFPLRKQAAEYANHHATGAVKDQWSLNNRDAGMRVVLPGTPGTVGTYHVRVRSSNLGPGDAATKLTDLSQVGAGRTKGPYQLQIRLREEDEFGGSSIQYSDIRYAVNGITVEGLPVHSPLTGEATELETTGGPNNDLFTTPQILGNLLASDQAAISVAGNLAPLGTAPSQSTDVDWYAIDLTYQDLEAIPGVTSVAQYFSTVFDIDYADGLARANTNLHIYDANGRLILRATDSNVAEDRPGPLSGTGLTDLSRGSVGALDPLVGPVELPVGRYFIAVSNNSQVPVELEQYLVANPANPLFRLEPINSLQRIVDEHIEPQDASTRPTGAPATTPRLIDLNASIVPFHLGDVTLYVTVDDTPLASGTSLYTVDPFTGAQETRVGGFNLDVGDIALRHQGLLQAFTTDLDDLARTDASSGNYLLIDTGTGAAANLGDDGIVTSHGNPAAPTTAIPSNEGIHFEAVTYTVIGGTEVGLAVGHRPPGATFANRPSIDYLDNILYQFDPLTGQAVSNPAGNRAGNGVLVGPGTNIVPRGHLDTTIGSQGGNSAIVAADATDIDPLTGQTTRRLIDGLHFRIMDTSGVVYQFELNSGPDIQILQDPAAGVFLRDGDSFSLDTVGYEFDTGSVLVVEATSGAGIRDGDIFTITDNQTPSVSRTFEFNNGVGGVGSGNVEIRYNSGFTRSQLITAMTTAINGAGFGVSAELLTGTNRISLLGESPVTPISGAPNNIRIEGSPGSTGSNLIIPVEETFTSTEVATAIADAINARNFGGVTVGARGDRVNFLGAQFGNFVSLVNAGLVRDFGEDGTVTVGRTAVPFRADQTGDEVAQAIARAITVSARIPGVTATVDGKIVNLTGATVTFADPPLLLGGAGPGGKINGMAFLGSRLFVISDRGGLFEVTDYLVPDGAQLRYISESANDLLGISFQGLAAGPKNADGGQYADMLFGIDAAGVVYAFDEFGHLQPVFADGATRAFTGLSALANGGAINGLAFSNLDFNLWHVTEREPAVDAAGQTVRAGHGVEAAFDGSRTGQSAQNPNQSLWFGFENFVSNNVLNTPADQEPTTRANTYDFPGGAHGTIETEPFSLAGYSPADQPVLYFTYFLETQGAASNPLTNPPTPMLDAARVFIGDGSGAWELLATNNSTRGTGSEYDNTTVDVQELFDAPAAGAQNWRQVRVPLDAFAGRDNLRLRFDFSTAGSMNIGGIRTGGDELRVVAASELRDGQTFEVDGVDVFEFDLGYTLVIPSGSAILDGETLTVDGIQFEFDRGDGLNGPGIAIPYAADQTASQIALTLRQLLEANRPTVPTLAAADLGREDNDDLTTAPTLGVAGESFNITATGSIGDNPSLIGTDRNLDVDLVRLELDLNATVTASIAAQTRNSPLDAALRVFDSNGVELAYNDNFNGVDPRLEFTAPATGTYFIGVASAANRNYDPQEVGSGTGGTIGPYDLVLNVMEAFAAHRNGNRLNLEGADLIQQSPSASVIVDGAPGTASPNGIVINSNMTDNEVATAVRFALANRYAGGRMEAIHGYEQVIRIIGHDVTDAGPLGVTEILPGDSFGEFTSTTRSLRSQANNFEGFYIDDIIIGFAERGEMATGALQSANPAFAANPLADPTDIQVGPYQLEVRGGEEYGDPQFSLVPPTIPATPGNLRLGRSFGTNDRLAEQVTLVAPSAEQLTDGQTFVISDGVDSVTFEYEDLLIGNGVAQGHVRIPFHAAALDTVSGAHSAEPAYVIAARIRDAINSPQVQSLLDITAALSDGTQSNTQFGVFESRDTRINLFGNAIVSTTSNTLTANLRNEPNDTLTDAVDSGVTAGNSDIFLTSGFIGDNASLAEPSDDVDLIRIELAAGERITIDLDTAPGVALDSYLRIFDEFGFPLGQFDNNDGSAPGEAISFDSFIDFTAPQSGAYFIGISSAGNDAYDPFVEGNDQQTGLTTGAYTIEIRRPDLIGSVGVVMHDGFGDKNHERQQGQLLIDSNRVSHSSEYGVSVGPGTRSAVDGMPHAGPVRVTRELNTDRLVPGVTISNNLLTENETGGIRFQGDATDALAPIPFGRIVNNTVVGGSVTFASASTPAAYNNVVFPKGMTSFADAVVSYEPLFNQGPGPDPLVGDPLAALAVPDYDPATGVGAVSLGRGGRLILEFQDNALTGSGDPAPDLYVAEVDSDDEEVFVEVSRDNVQYFAVGKVSSRRPLIDLDQFGFGPNDLFRFVRLTDDPNNGPTSGFSVGADIDAVGAITAYLPPNFTAGGNGIVVENAASPTLLNNIVVNSETGILIDATSTSTVVGGTLYQFNTTKLSHPNTAFGLGDFPIDLPDNERLFVAPELGNYYLAGGARGIDSAIDSLQDRQSLIRVKTPLGLPRSPILAPSLDLTGQMRADDPAVRTPSGIGEDVFKDRGALDRADFVGPTGSLVNPKDNDGAGLDANLAESIVELSSVSLSNFSIQLLDGIAPVDPSDGIGADDATVRAGTVTVFKGTNADNLQPLIQGVDYTFDYDSTNNIIRITPLAGIWEPDRLYRVQLANQQRFIVTVPSPSNVIDGDTFYISDRFGHTASFEYDSGYTINLPTSSSVTDGESFTIDDGTKIVTFEFDDNNSVVASPTRRPIVFTSTSTVDETANAVITAIVGAGVGLTPKHVGGGIIHLGGSALHVVDVTNSTLTLAGKPGVSPAHGIQVPSAAGKPIGLVDGATFTISLGSQTVTFELDTNGAFTAGRRQVRFFANSGVNAVADALVTAIAGSGLALTPVNKGGGIVAIGGTPNHVIDVLSSGLVEVGAAGIPGAIALPVADPTASADSLAAAVAAKINASNPPLESVTAEAIGANVVIDGASGFSGVAAVNVSAIKDLAGNPIKPNRNDGTTSFDILLGSGLDFGDAPDGPYASKLANNGARHTIRDGFFLGNGVTVDVDGPGPDQADSDRLDDGVTLLSNFRRGYNATYSVTVNGGSGVLDAWIDFNQDGDFNDPFERILTGVQVTAGTHTLQLQNKNPAATDIEAQGEVPGDAVLGATYARFRLSSTGVSGPTGLATDGEVEDFQIQILQNPYQNPTNRLDVNADGFISPIDALLVINYLITPGAGPLPLPRASSGPPFWDVDGNGEISPIDAALVVGELNRLAAGGEGESPESFISGSMNDSTPIGNDETFAGSFDASPATTSFGQGAASAASLGNASRGNISLGNEPVVNTPAASRSAATRLSSTAFPASLDSSVSLRARGSLLASSISSSATHDEADAAEVESHVGKESRSEVSASLLAGPASYDLEDLLDDIAIDVDEAKTEQSAHDEFFANIHFD